MIGLKTRLWSWVCLWMAGIGWMSVLKLQNMRKARMLIEHQRNCRLLNSAGLTRLLLKARNCSSSAVGNGDGDCGTPKNVHDRHLLTVGWPECKRPYRKAGVLITQVPGGRGISACISPTGGCRLKKSKVTESNTQTFAANDSAELCLPVEFAKAVVCRPEMRRPGCD
jgi:hypothetical protein